MPLSKLDVVLYLEGKEPRCFKGCERSLLEIKSFFMHTLLVWSVVLSYFSCSSLPALLEHCNFGS